MCIALVWCRVVLHFDLRIAALPIYTDSLFIVKAKSKGKRKNIVAKNE